MLSQGHSLSQSKYSNIVCFNVYSGRRWVDEHYDWRRVYGQWDEVYTIACRQDLKLRVRDDG